MDKAYERERRYYQTEKGKRARAKANAKSGAKRYIKEFATAEDLEELKNLIRVKEMEVKKMTINERIEKMVKENGNAYLLRTCTLQIAHKKKPLSQYDWNRIEDNLNYTIEGVYATKEEAERALEPNWRTFNNSGCRFVDFYTGEIAWLCEDHLKQAEEEDITIEEFLDSGDVSFESGYLGMEEFEEFLKEWIG